MYVRGPPPRRPSFTFSACEAERHAVNEVRAVRRMILGTITWADRVPTQTCLGPQSDGTLWAVPSDASDGRESRAFPREKPSALLGNEGHAFTPCCFPTWDEFHAENGAIRDWQSVCPGSTPDPMLPMDTSRRAGAGQLWGTGGERKMGEPLSISANSYPVGDRPSQRCHGPVRLG
jgi:hypothetical protein